MSQSQTNVIAFFLSAQSVISTKCLEGTTERSDSNRARSVRINEDGTMCLEGTTPKDSSLYIATSLLFSRPYLISCITRALRTWLLSLRSVLLSNSYLSCGVVPSRHIVLAPSRRTLRARLPSLRSVVPSRHAKPNKNPLPIFSIANKRYRLFPFCAERDFAVCNFYASAFSEILKV